MVEGGPPKPWVLWAADSQSYIAKITAKSGADEYWWVPLDARPAHKLDLGAEHDAFGLPASAMQGGRVSLVHHEPAPQFCEIWMMNLQFAGGGK